MDMAEYIYPVRLDEADMAMLAEWSENHWQTFERGTEAREAWHRIMYALTGAAMEGQPVAEPEYLVGLVHVEGYEYKSTEHAVILDSRMGKGERSPGTSACGERVWVVGHHDQFDVTSQRACRKCVRKLS
jgi:hypothetical protein